MHFYMQIRYLSSEAGSQKSEVGSPMIVIGWGANMQMWIKPWVHSDSDFRLRFFTDASTFKKDAGLFKIIVVVLMRC